jgi:membrane protein implicated in regulation of membrane protease activity
MVQMDWSPATWWWITTGILIAAELATGTFYLLMLALGVAAAALSAHAGVGFSAQLMVAALVGGGAVALWHLRRVQQQRGAPPAAANRDVNLDVGERVNVAAWSPDGTARVHYRGANWSARHAGPDAPSPGPHVIAEVRGNELVLRRAN